MVTTVRPIVSEAINQRNQIRNRNACLRHRLLPSFANIDFFFFCSYAKIRVEIWFSDFLLGYASRCCFLYYQNLYIGISLHRIATTTRPTKIIISMTRVKTFRINKIVLWIHIDDNYNYRVAKASNRFNIESEVFEGWYKEIIKNARLRIIAITVGSVRGHAA